MSYVQNYVRVAAILFLISIVGGSIGEFYVPTKLIVLNDPSATAANILANERLLRLGFAGYLLEGLSDAALALIFYVLLKPVHRNLALLAALIGVVSTAHYAVCQMLYFCAPILLKNPVFVERFSREQLDALIYLFVRISGYGASLFLAFYGSASLVRGFLMYRSGYLPKFLGALLSILGVAFILRSFTLVLAPTYSSELLLLPAPLTLIAMTTWFLVKGVDVRKWNARVLAMRAVADPSLT
ncbi:MAG TPA: DUF4386 domain-containing protein [Gemmatimonadaceae bacterium]|nr:DUF4386 domain-containing protein [Gemmatimonadaceae bacterium]